MKDGVEGEVEVEVEAEAEVGVGVERLKAGRLIDVSVFLSVRVFCGG